MVPPEPEPETPRDSTPATHPGFGAGPGTDDVAGWPGLRIAGSTAVEDCTSSGKPLAAQ